MLLLLHLDLYVNVSISTYLLFHIQVMYERIIDVFKSYIIYISLSSHYSLRRFNIVFRYMDIHLWSSLSTLHLHSTLTSRDDIPK
jgi:hypothetical protein